MDLLFRMLDSRSNTPVHYEHVNAETSEEVPWKEIVKTFEYEKGSDVVLDPEDIKSAASESHETVEVNTFIDADSVGPEYFEEPYLLVPAKKAEKAYVLLRETLKRTGKIGIARVVIRMREYLSAVMPRDNALMPMLLRYPQELVDAEECKILQGTISSCRISPKEITMAEQFIKSMSNQWDPGDYRNEFRDRPRKVIERRLKSKGVVTPPANEDAATPENVSTNVVDFMVLLQKSLASNKRTPAKKAASGKADKSTSKKSGEKPTASTKKKSTRKAAKKSSPRKVD